MKNISELSESKAGYMSYKTLTYILRCLMITDCLTRFMTSKQYDIFAKPLGIDGICESYERFKQSDDKEKIKNDIVALCKKVLDSDESQGNQYKYKVLQDNFDLLKDILHLSQIDCDLLELAIITNSDESIFRHFLSAIDKEYENIDELHFVIANMLNCNKDLVSLALGKSGILKKLCILDKTIESGNTIANALAFCNDDFKETLLREQNDYSAFAECFVIFPCDKNVLNLSDFLHIKELDMIINYLKSAKDSRKKGVNILLYGICGAGKSELARIIAKSVGAILYNININENKRIVFYNQAQNALDSSNDILLYDEIDDMLECEKTKIKQQAFFNQALSNNNIPTIWIANKDIYEIDNDIDKTGNPNIARDSIKKLLLKFDFVIAMYPNEINIRKAMINKIADKRLNQKTLNLIENNPNIAPNIINKANKISDSLKGDFSNNFIAVVNNALKSQEHCEISENVVCDSYSTDFINADIEFDIADLINGLNENPNARICLYGVSGTGKSAYAKYIAKMLNRPCLIKSVSDLESTWMGETEQNIARAFREAKSKNAVLVFDEVDSFLNDRNFEVRSTDKTKVNEMLVQLENFDGIFIATTNLINSLDKAVLRRFDLKIEFKALDSAQRANLFAKECEILGLKCDESLKNQIARLDGLTPGDFAAVKRQNRFSHIKSTENFYKRLCNEVKVKDLDNGDKNIGFLKGDLGDLKDSKDLKVARKMNR